jgi:hypothetical protein
LPDNCDLLHRRSSHKKYRFRQVRGTILVIILQELVNRRQNGESGRNEEFLSTARQYRTLQQQFNNNLSIFLSFDQNRWYSLMVIGDQRQAALGGSAQDVFIRYPCKRSW